MFSMSVSRIHPIQWAVIYDKNKSCRITHPSPLSHRIAEVMAKTCKSEQESFKITFLCCTTTTHTTECADFQFLGRDNKSDESESKG